MLEQIITSLVRTITPWVIGVVVTLLAKAGLDWHPSAEAFLLVSQLVSAAFYALARLLELRFGRLWGLLLGVPKAPTYDATAKADDASPTGESAAPASEIPEGTPVETEPIVFDGDLVASELTVDDDSGTDDGGLTGEDDYAGRHRVGLLGTPQPPATLVGVHTGDMPKGRVGILAALVVLGILEAIGIATDSDTISGLTADVFQVDTAGGRYAFAVAWIAFAGWFLWHILTWVRSVKARGSVTAARLRR